MADLPHQVRALLLKQEGVSTRPQLLRRGMTGAGVRHARRAGRLHDLYPGYGVYAGILPELLSDDARLMAAILTTDGRAVVAVGTAAHRWELIPAPPRQIMLASRLEIVVPPGIELRRTVMRPGDVIRSGRFRTTTVTRTLLDLAVRYEQQPLLRALREAEYHHRVHPDDILAVLRRGHPGSAKLRAALELHVPGYGQMKSRLERRFRGLLVQHAIDLPRRNMKIGEYTVDCVWLELRVIVELDGGQHLRPAQRVIDADRDLWLRGQGYIVRRYTWKQVTGRDRHLVIADLLHAFEEARILGLAA